MPQSNTLSHNPIYQSAKLITGFSIEKIIFDEGNYVTLWVQCRLHNVLSSHHLVMPFAQLNDILRFSGPMGEKVLLKMLDIIMFTNKPPYVLEIATDLQCEVVITSCKLKVNNMLHENQLVPDCYYVQEVLPINIIQQAKNLHQHLLDFKCAELTAKQQENNLDALSKMYMHYLGLIELDIKETVARDRAKLVDTRLFKMAQSAYNQKQK